MKHVKWNKALVLQCLQEDLLPSELMQQQQPQMPKLMQRLQAQPRRMKIQELMGGNGQGEEELNQEMMER